MSEYEKELGKVVDTVSVYEVMASVGIPLLVASEELFNNCETASADWLLQLSTELYTLSSVLASCSNQHEPRFKKLMVHLPEGIGALRIKNPIYDDRSRPAPSDDRAGSEDLGDNFPF